MGSLAIDVKPDGIDFTIYIPSVKGHILQSKRHRCNLQGDEVLVTITHAGLSSLNVCHQFTSHQAHGNTGVGIVQEVGPNVMDLKKSDNVGFSYARTTCGTCQHCLKRCFDFCPSRVSYGDPIRGIATHTVRREEFFFKIPSAVDKITAAALLCGGATLFNIIDAFHIKYENRVGIVGVGRMGRLAIQFAAKLGCDVVVLTRMAEKRELAMSLGAKEYYTTTGRQHLEITKPLSHLLITTSVPPNWSLYTPLLAPGAVIYPLTLGTGTLEIPVMDMLSRGLRIEGNLIATNKAAVKMLDFAARERVKPQTKAFELDAMGIEHALWWMERGSEGERAVLVARDEADETMAEVRKMKPYHFHKECV